MLPADEVRRYKTLQPADQTRWQHSLHQPAENAAESDIDLRDHQVICAVVLLDLERNVGDANHFASLGVDNLLIEQIAHQPQHVLVGMIRREYLVFEVNAV